MSEQETIKQMTPFALKCRQCGSPLNYDIINENYSCDYCDEKTPIDKQRDDIETWIERQKRALDDAKNQAITYACPSCGAKVNGFVDSATTICDFCGSPVIKEDFILSKNFPLGIIPFTITQEEATVILDEWIGQNRRTKEAKRFKGKSAQLRGIYLPYQLYSGPVDFKVVKIVSDRESVSLDAHSYVNQKSIIACKGLPNEIMDQIEPFDFRKLQDFRFEYLAGIHAKTQDKNQNQVGSDYQKETIGDLKTEFSEKLKTPYIDIEITDNKTQSIPVLLPVYYIEEEGEILAINGQTGKIAITTGKKKVRRPWLIEPTIITFMTWLLSGIILINHAKIPLQDWRLILMCFLEALLFTFVVALVVFIVYGDAKQPIISNKFITGKSNYERGANKQLIKKENLLLREDIQKPVFYDYYHGTYMPVEINFNPAIRTIKNAISLILFIWLPSLVAIPLFPLVRRGEPFSELFGKPFFMAGGAWFALSVPLAFIAIIAVIRRDLFGNYYIRPIDKSGKYEKTGDDLSGTSATGIFSGVLGSLKEGGCLSVGFVALFLFFFLGSLIAILSGDL